MSSGQDWSRCSRNKRPLFNAPSLINLVFSEGQNSEPFYTDGLKREAEKSGYILKGSLIIDHSIAGEQGKKLIGDVEGKVHLIQRELQDKRGRSRIANVWISFDFDNKPQEYQDAFDAIEKLNRKELSRKPDQRIRWVPCWSNYCFEEWLLLHFFYCETSFDEKTLEDKLSEAMSLPGSPYTYSKVDDKIFGRVYSKERTEFALKNARRLNEKALAKGKPYRNPTSGVSAFVSFVLKNVLNDDKKE